MDTWWTFLRTNRSTPGWYGEPRVTQAFMNHEQEPRTTKRWIKDSNCVLVCVCNSPKLHYTNNAKTTMHATNNNKLWYSGGGSALFPNKLPDLAEDLVGVLQCSLGALLLKYISTLVYTTCQDMASQEGKQTKTHWPFVINHRGMKLSDRRFAMYKS